MPMRFDVAYIPKENGKDVFELESKNGKNSIEREQWHFSGQCIQLLAEELCALRCKLEQHQSGYTFSVPDGGKKIRKVTPHKYRHYFNYCTFNYTSSWWDWDRWQWEIRLYGFERDQYAIGDDWPECRLGSGFTAIWDLVMPIWMHSLQVLPISCGSGLVISMHGADHCRKSWMTSHEALQKKILARERELGMTPILPAFTGHVPPTFKDKYPKAKLKKINWEGRFDDTYILDADDPLFNEIGNRFMEEQIKTFGTDHLYGADTFNEMYPPSNDSIYLNNISSAVYKSMAAVDPEADLGDAGLAVR